VLFSSTALSSIQGDRPAERVIGFRLLRRHVEIMFTNAESEEELRNAYNQYISAIDLLESYLRSPPDAATEAAGEPADLGFGRPRIPADNRYALRGANLTGSIWGASFLQGAHLQCANLEGAELQHTHLDGADLRGANLEGADFTGAELDGVNFDGVTGWQKAKGLPKDLRPEPGISRITDGIDRCLDHKPYWNMSAASRSG
jgi:hypothetical protein